MYNKLFLVVGLLALVGCSSSKHDVISGLCVLPDGSPLPLSPPVKVESFGKLLSFSADGEEGKLILDQSRCVLVIK